MTDARSATKSDIDYVVEMLISMAETDVHDELAAKVRNYLGSVSRMTDTSFAAVITSLKKSGDPELVKFGDSLVSFQTEGQYGKLLSTSMTDCEIVPYTLEEIRSMNPFVITGSSRGHSHVYVNSLIDFIHRFNNKRYASLSDDDELMMESYSNMARNFGFYIEMIFDTEHEQKKKMIGSMSQDELMVYCRKENPVLQVYSFVTYR